MEGLRRGEHSIDELRTGVSCNRLTHRQRPQFDYPDSTGERVSETLRGEETCRTREDKLTAGAVTIEAHLGRQEEWITGALELIDGTGRTKLVDVGSRVADGRRELGRVVKSTGAQRRPARQSIKSLGTNITTRLLPRCFGPRRCCRSIASR